MSNDQKNQNQPAAAQPMKPIPIRVLFFRSQMNLPGTNGGSSLTSDPTAKKRWMIQLEPWLRHYRITFIDEVHNVSVTRLLHETLVLDGAEPME